MKKKVKKVFICGFDKKGNLDLREIVFENQASKMEFKGTKGELELIKIDFADYFQISICSKEENKVVAQIFGYDKQEAEANALLFSKARKMRKELVNSREVISELRLLISAHPDNISGSEFEDYVNIANDQESSIKKVLKEATEIE